MIKCGPINLIRGYLNDAASRTMIVFRVSILIFLGVAPVVAAWAPSDFQTGTIQAERVENCLSPEQITARDIAADAVETELIRNGVLSAAGIDKTTVLFRFPLQAAAGLTTSGFHWVYSYVDHDPLPGGNLDYNCGTERNLNQGGSSGWHTGTDFNIWPYTWNKMDQMEVEIVAAADGVIIGRYEGYRDRNCAGPNQTPGWNGIGIQHSDGTRTWYVHLKQYSVTEKQIGQSVVEGEYLGIVGSSGPSRSPHLHFEIYKNGQIIDPYEGPCNTKNLVGRWQEQPGYPDPAILEISTHDSPVQWMPCPQPDLPNTKNHFDAGESFWFYTFGRDGSAGDDHSFAIEGPSGQILESWDHQFDPLGEFKPNYYLAWQFTLPLDAEPGTYRVTLISEGNTYSHEFSVEQTTSTYFRQFNALSSSEGIHLSWEITNSFTSYNFSLSRNQESGAAWEIIAILSDTREYLDQDVEAGARYNYLLEVEEAGGGLLASSSLDATWYGTKLMLRQSHPNPAIDGTSIEFVVGQTAPVRLIVYDLRGRMVRVLIDRTLGIGTHITGWDGRDEEGLKVGAGVYFYRLETDKQVRTRKVAVLR